MAERLHSAIARLRSAALLSLALLAAACRPSAPAPPETELRVLAASSLREAFLEAGEALEKSFPGTHVSCAFAGSQELGLQLEHGAQADLFASADEEHLEALRAQGLVGAPQIFARNEPVLVVPTGNPAHLHALRDLPRAARVVLGGGQVPIGAYSDRILAAAAKAYGAQFAEQVQRHIVSREPNVRQVLAKVTLGEADAAIVYRSDALVGRGSVELIAIPPELNRLAAYPAAVLSQAQHPRLAQAFIDYLLSPLGQSLLVRRGFTAVQAAAAR